jgi:ABC-type Fe3+ transport system permease subunit
MNNTPIVVITIALMIVAVIGIWAYAWKIRPTRKEERLLALEKGQNPELFFSGRLLHYIPWQFWTSFAILLLLIIAYFISSGGKNNEGQKSFLELIKYMTGAVVGSLFGKGNTAETGQGFTAIPSKEDPGL